MEGTYDDFFSAIHSHLVHLSQYSLPSTHMRTADTPSCRNTGQKQHHCLCAVFALPRGLIDEKEVYVVRTKGVSLARPFLFTYTLYQVTGSSDWRRRKLLEGRAGGEQFHAIAAAPRLIPLCMRVR